MPSGATGDSPAAAVDAGRLYLVVRGLDGFSLWFGAVNLTDNSFTGWIGLGGVTESAPTLVALDEQLALVVRGLDNRIYYRFYDLVGETWGTWSAWPSGATGDGPAAVVVDDELHIVVRGLDGYSLWHSNLNMTRVEFSGWEMIGGASESTPTLTAAGSSLELYLAVRGLDNLTYYNVWNDVGWNGWISVPTGATCDAPGATVTNDKLQIVVRGMDESSLWHGYVDLTTEDFAGWSWLSGATESAPTVTS